MTRLERLQKKLRDQTYDALLVYQPDELRYLTGARGTLVRLLVTADRARLFSHFIDLEQTAEEAPGVPLVESSDLGGLPELADIAAEWGIARLGLDLERVTLGYQQSLAEALAPRGIELVSDQQIVRSMRRIKDEDELELIRQATAINDAAYAYALPLLKPGVTERAVATEIRHFMWQAGVEAIRFLVVQFGPHSARPHFYPTDRPLQIGDWVLMDWVPIYAGYGSDVTRTVVVGRADERQREIYRLVQEAQRAGLAGVRPGAIGDEVDAMARQIIVDGGYGEAFGHSLGHGINEGPNLNIGSSDVLQPGMVVTVEPGIYLPGWGGVRIEDTVVVREDGVEVLPKTPKDLVVV